MTQRMVRMPPPTARSAQAGVPTAPGAPRPPAFYELAGQHLDETSAGRRCRHVRGQNFSVGYTWIRTGETLSEIDIPDEHFVLVPEATEIAVSVVGHSEVPVVGPALVVVPAGTSQVVARSTGALMRVFTARAVDVLARACNNALYEKPDPAVAPLPAEPEPGPGTVRVYRADDIPEDSTRFGRIFRTDSLMINWLPPQLGARDTDSLTPHVHDDFEQASVTLRGDHIHHLRSPWTPRLREWRDDQHIQCASPSITIIPPGNIHTTRAVGDGVHHLVDVFAPPRSDFLDRGWVINAADYPTSIGGVH